MINEIVSNKVKLPLDSKLDYENISQFIMDNSSLDSIQMGSYQNFIDEVIPKYLGRTYEGGASKNIKYKLSFDKWWISDENLLTEEKCLEQKESQELTLKAIVRITFFSSFYPKKWVSPANYITHEVEVTRFPYLNKKGYFIINGSPRIVIGFPAGADKILLTPLKSKTKSKELRFEENLRASTKSSGIISRKNTIVMDTTGIKISTSNEGILNYHNVLSKLGYSDEHLIVERITGNNPLFLSQISESKNRDKGSNIRNERNNINNLLKEYILKDDYQRNELNKRLSLETNAVGYELAENINTESLGLLERGKKVNKEMARALTLEGRQNISLIIRGMVVPVLSNGFVPMVDLLEMEDLPLSLIPNGMKRYTKPFIELGNGSPDKKSTGLEEVMMVNRELFYKLLDETRKTYGDSGEEIFTEKLKDVFKVNESLLKGMSILPKDLLAMINLYSRYLMDIEKEDDIDSLENKRLIYISEVFEEGLVTSLEAMIEKLNRTEKSLFGNSSTNWSRSVESPLGRVTGTTTITSQATMHPLYEILDTTNPLSQINVKRKVSSKKMEGYDGGVPQESSDTRQRSVNHSFSGRLDVIETPESGSVGLVRHISMLAQLNKDRELVTPFLRVDKKNKKIDLSTIHYLNYGEEKKYNRILSPKISKEDGVRIEYYRNQNIVETELIPVNTSGNNRTEIYEQMAITNMSKYKADNFKISFHKKNWFTEEDNLVFLTGEGVTKEGKWDDIDLVSVSGSHIFSPVSSSIPFIEYDDATRAMMGSIMGKQAISIWGKEKQQIFTPITRKVSLNSNGVIVAPYDCIINSVDSEGIWISPITAIGDDDKEEFISLVKNERTVKTTLNKSRPCVKVGDMVLEFELLADNSSTIDGELTHGTNLLIGYMPIDGHNYEDAILISDRLLREDTLTSFHIEEYQMPMTYTGNELESDRLTKDLAELEKLGSHIGISQNEMNKLRARETDYRQGIIKVGTKVSQGDILCYKIAKKSDITQENNEKIFIERYKEKVPGVVVDVVYIEDKTTFIIKVATRLKISVGDKLTGRHGNKGVISKIVPEADMPYMENGRRLDVCLTPLGIPSRMNLGQVLEGLAGFKLQSLGVRGEVEQMAGFNIDKFREVILDESGTDKKQLYNPKTGEPYRFKTMVVLSYIEKLEHISSQKIHARGFGTPDCTYSVNKQPLQGKASNGGQRLGEMEMWILEDHGCSNIVRELVQYKSDDEVSRKIYADHVEMNLKNPDTASEDFDIPANVPYALRTMNALMTGYYSVQFYDDNDNRINPDVPNVGVDYKTSKVRRRVINRDYELQLKARLNDRHIDNNETDEEYCQEGIEVELQDDIQGLDLELLFDDQDISSISGIPEDIWDDSEIGETTLPILNAVEIGDFDTSSLLDGLPDMDIIAVLENEIEEEESVTIDEDEEIKDEEEINSEKFNDEYGDTDDEEEEEYSEEDIEYREE